MSKAFTRESDDSPDLPSVSWRPSALPPGVKNYLTPGGARRLREELERLEQTVRSDSAADARDAHGLDHRIRQLQECLRSAEIVAPPPPGDDRIRFGATVTVRDRNGGESQYRIVGVDETDIDRGWVSWLSPIAKALINRRCGERVRFRFPSGEEELEVLKVDYE